MVAETARLRCDLTEVTMPDELVVGLTQLTSYRTDLMGDGVARINRLRSLLGSIFPALEAAFDYSAYTRSSWSPTWAHRPSCGPLESTASLCSAHQRCLPCRY